MAKSAAAPQYKAPAGGGYSVEEHLAAQQGQTHPTDGKPLHQHKEPDAPEPTSSTREPEPEDDGDDDAIDQAGDGDQGEAGATE